jgi:glycosyltransferase involved in cell wall biosynthesis
MNLKEQPLVSVIMTAYNREKYIGQAIQSVLSSTYQNFELIVVDDRSKDDTLAIANKFMKGDSRIRVFENGENLGDYPNRNRAASYAKGRYIKFLDADDLIYFYGLEVMVNYMEQFPEAGFGLASAVSSEKPFPILLSPRETYMENFSGFGHFDRAPGSSIIRLDAFNKVGGFSGKRMIGDYEFWYKIARYYNMVKFPFDLYWNRAHSEQESKTSYAKNYPVLRKKIMEDALSDPDCPLNSKDLEIVRKFIKKNERRDNFFKGISKIKTTLKGK